MVRVHSCVEVRRGFRHHDRRVREPDHVDSHHVAVADRLVGEEIELSAEKQIIAKGEVVVIEDRLGVSITKIMKSQ